MIANISLLPMGKGPSLTRLVSLAVDEVDRSGLDYRLTAMGTLVEGEWKTVMRLIKKMRDRVMKHADRVYLVVTIDDKKTRERRLSQKVRAVERALGKPLKK